jgi:hypothetical protein
LQIKKPTTIYITRRRTSMKITKTKLRQIIQEEIAKIKEGGARAGAISRRELTGYASYAAKKRCEDQGRCFDKETNDCKDCEDSRPLEEADETKDADADAESEKERDEEPKTARNRHRPRDDDEEPHGQRERRYDRRRYGR